MLRFKTRLVQDPKKISPENAYFVTNSKLEIQRSKFIKRKSFLNAVLPPKFKERERKFIPDSKLLINANSHNRIFHKIGNAQDRENEFHDRTETFDRTYMYTLHKKDAPPITKFPHNLFLNHDRARYIFIYIIIIYKIFRTTNPTPSPHNPEDKFYTARCSPPERFINNRRLFSRSLMHWKNIIPTQQSGIFSLPATTSAKVQQNVKVIYIPLIF